MKSLYFDYLVEDFEPIIIEDFEPIDELYELVEDDYEDEVYDDTIEDWDYFDRCGEPLEKEIKNLIEKASTIEDIAIIEGHLDVYSDIFKEAFFFRPSLEPFRMAMFERGLKPLWDEFESLPYDRALKMMYPNNPNLN